MQIVAVAAAHAASNHLGDNAIYKVLPITDAISRLNRNWATTPRGTARSPSPT